MYNMSKPGADWSEQQNTLSQSQKLELEDTVCIRSEKLDLAMIPGPHLETHLSGQSPFRSLLVPNTQAMKETKDIRPFQFQFWEKWCSELFGCYLVIIHIMNLVN